MKKSKGLIFSVLAVLMVAVATAAILLIPKNSGDEVGLILMIHGGAWVAGDKSAYRDLIKTWADKGYAAATINYRYLDYDVSFDDILDDIESVFKLCKTIEGITDLQQLKTPFKLISIILSKSASSVSVMRP